MAEHFQRVLQKSKAVLVHNIANGDLEEVLDMLESDLVLSRSDGERITSRQTSHEKVRELMIILYYRGYQGYNSFKKALEKLAFHALDEIKKHELSETIVTSDTYAPVFGTLDTASVPKFSVKRKHSTSSSGDYTVVSTSSHVTELQPQQLADLKTEMFPFGAGKIARITRWQKETRIDVRQFANREEQTGCRGLSMQLYAIKAKYGLIDKNSTAEYEKAVAKSNQLIPTTKGVSMNIEQLNALQPILNKNLNMLWSLGSNGGDAEEEPDKKEATRQVLGRNMYVKCSNQLPYLDLHYSPPSKKGLSMNYGETLNLVDILDTFHQIVHTAPTQGKREDHGSSYSSNEGEQ